MKSSALPARSAAGEQWPRRAGQMLKLFAAAVFLALSLPLGLLAGLMGWHQHRILTAWPLADAVVTSADRAVTTNRGGRQPATYSVRFGFRYTAGGQVYHSSAQVGPTSVPSQAERWLQQLPVGTHTSLRYDPHNPANISLAADRTPDSFAVPLKLARWAGLATALSAVLFFLGWRAGKEEAGVGVNSRKSERSLRGLRLLASCLRTGFRR